MKQIADTLRSSHDHFPDTKDLCAVRIGQLGGSGDDTRDQGLGALDGGAIRLVEGDASALCMTDEVRRI